MDTPAHDRVRVTEAPRLAPGGDPRPVAPGTRPRRSGGEALHARTRRHLVLQYEAPWRTIPSSSPSRHGCVAIFRATGPTREDDRALARPRRAAYFTPTRTRYVTRHG